MKNYLLLTLLLLSTIGLSQKIPTTNQTVELEEPTTQTEITSIWGTINGDGPNTNPILDSLIEVNGLIVSNPLKNSRNKELQSVYQFQSPDCDITTLIEDLKLVGVENIELTSTPSQLGVEIDDYNKVFTTDYALDLIKAKEAWEVNTGNRTIKIGISDSNFDINHEELINKFSLRVPSNNSDYVHGTAVATAAAGNTNNSVGKSAIGYNCDLMLYPMSYNSILQAAYAGVNVINLSWASGCNFNLYQQQAIDEALSTGMIIVASAGNGGTCGGASNYVYPASYEGVISVSSIGANDNHEKTIGNPNTTHQHNDKVDLVAPGYNVPLAFPNNTYGYGNGTSFASPIVAGTIGLMLAEEPNLSNCEVEYILKKSAVNIDSLNPNYEGLLGEGRLDAGSALNLTKEFELFSLRHEVVKNGGDALLIINGSGTMEFDSLNYTFKDYAYLGNGSEAKTYNVEYTSIYGCKTTVEYIVEEEEFSLFNDTNLVILPIELIDFSAKPIKDKIEVEWITGSENNNSHFITEKTFDGRFWYGLTITQGKGTTSEETQYTEFDFSPKVGVQYYRLTQVDYNGDKTIYSPISINYGETGNMLSLYPNPSNGEINIKWTNSVEDLLIYDQTGNLIKKIKPNENDVKTTLDGFKPGFYMVTTIIEGEIFNIKFIITS
jgi:subtilisin family serine protease